MQIRKVRGAALKGASRAGRRAIACLALLLVTPARAQYEDAAPLPTWYLGPMASYTIPDSGRDAKNALGLQLVAGRVLAEAMAVELSLFGARLDSNTDGGPETELTGGGLDLALGLPDPGSPVFLIGAGSVSQDIGGVKKRSAYGNLGLAIYLPFTFGGELWRLEGRYRAVFSEHPALPDQDAVEDVLVNFGALFAFGREEPAPPPPPPSPPAPVADADGDGVADAADQCPGTPRWARPDATGCVPDSDGDGVDDAHDDCPGTPPGVTVDADGCEPRAALAPAMLDEDGDGVGDADDACPHTVPQFKVDTKGCLIPEDVTLRNVHFSSSSSWLTADGYQLLRSVAASLKAQPGITLEVAGHADASGGAQMNQELSLERAEVVRDFLTYLGIAGSRFTVKAYGEHQPLTDNKTRESRSFNRRVQFRRTDE